MTAKEIHIRWQEKRTQLRARPFPSEEQMELLAFGSEAQHEAWQFYRQNLKLLGSHEEAVKRSFWYLADTED